MEEYLAHVKDLADELSVAGAPMADADLIYITLGGLPPAYDPVATAIRLRPEPLTMEELCSYLCSEAIHVEKQTQTKAPPQSSSPDLTMAYSAAQRPNHNPAQHHPLRALDLVIVAHSIVVVEAIFEAPGVVFVDEVVIMVIVLSLAVRSVFALVIQQWIVGIEFL